MSEAETYSHLKVALLSSLINPKHKTDTSSKIQNIFSSNNLQSYVLELKKCLMIMKKYMPTEIITPFKGNCLEITKCGRFFVFGSVEGRIGVVDASTKEILKDISLDGGSIYSLALFNNDLNFIAAGKDGIIRLFDFSTCEVIRRFKGHEQEVNKVLVSTDESLAFSASDDGTVRVWNLNNENESQILYYHEKHVLCLDKSQDGKYLLSGGADRAIKLFNLETEVVEVSLGDFASSVWTVKVSKSHQFIAGGDSNGNIKIWETQGFSLVKVLTGHEKRITHIEFNETEQLLISSSNDQTLRVWDLAEDKNELVLTGHTAWIKAFKLSHEGNYIYSIDENCRILSWHFPKFNKSSRHRNHQNPISFMSYSRNNHLIYTSDSTETKIWDVKTKSLIKSMKHEHLVTSMAVDFDHLTLLIAFSNYDLYSWNADQETFKLMYQHTTMLTVLLPSPDGRYIVLADINYRVMVLFRRKFEISNVFRNHHNLINVLVFSKPVMSENNVLFSAGEDTDIYIHFIKENKSRKLPNSHTSAVTALNVSRNNEFLVSGDQEGNVKIWSIEQTILVKSLKPHVDRITGIYFSEDLKYFWISSRDSSISLWNSISFSKVTHLKSKLAISSFVCTKNEEELVLTEGQELNFIDNPLKTNRFFIYGPGREYYSFMKYIIDISEGNEPVYDPNMDSWIVTPYVINALHFYAYFNLVGFLKTALKNKGPFYISKSDYSPLSIAIHRNFRDCINTIIKQIRLNVQEDPYSISFIEKSIIKLNEVGFKGLDEFYSAIFYKSKSRLLPKFCSEDVKLPIVIQSRNIEPQQKDFFTPDMVSHCGKPVTFWQSALRLNIEMGSNDSISFLESLLICPNSNIFKAQFIRDLISYKWGYLKWVLMPQAATYLTYFICLSAFLVFFDGKSVFLLSIIFILNVLLAAYECFQLVLTKSKYFRDPWNYIDFFRMSLCFIFIAFPWVPSDTLIKNQILVFLIFLSCVRGISYFRLFESTRYMINLLGEVIKDMKSFIILLFYSTYSFAIIYFIMINNVKKFNPESGKELQPFSYYIADTYLLNLGQFDTENYGTFEWVIFFFASVINPLIMLNLLISIMGDTFGRVKEEQEIASMKELTGMVIEGEYILFCRRLSGKMNFMQICKEEEIASTEANSIENEIGLIKGRILAIEELLMSKTEEMKSDIDQNTVVLDRKVDELTDLVEKISLSMD